MAPRCYERVKTAASRARVPALILSRRCRLIWARNRNCGMGWKPFRIEPESGDSPWVSGDAAEGGCNDRRASSMRHDRSGKINPVTLYRRSPEARAALRAVLAQHLAAEADVKFAYLHGSFLSAGAFHDL